MIEGNLDLSHYKWRLVEDEADKSYLIHHDYTILGYDLDAGVIDMIVRWGKDGGHCALHRHMTTTTVFVLEGEQHLFDVAEDGTVAKEPRVRKAGDYALSTGVETPHLERGGPEGGAALYSTHVGKDGVMYEILDEDLNLVIPITIDLLVADFQALAS